MDKTAEFIAADLARGWTPGVSTLSFSPDGSLLAIGSSNRPLQLWRVSDAQLLRQYEWGGPSAYLAAFSPDGAIVAGGLGGGGLDQQKVMLIRISDWTMFRLLEDFQRGVSMNNLSFTPDGTILAAGGYDSTVRLWQVTDDAPVTPVQTFAGSRAVFSPDGQLLATAQADGSVQVWQPFGGGLAHTLIGHTGEVNTLAFSPDGALLASGSRDNTIRLWRVSDGSLVNTLKGHTGAVQSVAFSPDGAILASGSQDTTVRLWNVAEGILLSTLEDHSIMVWTVAFSPQGVLASGAADNTVKIWQVQ